MYTYIYGRNIRNIYILLLLQTFLFSADYYADTTETNNSFCSQSNPFENIQTAIDLTSNGDVVLVSGSTYLENLLIIETGITLKSADGADPAIIDGSSPYTDPALWNGGSCIVIRTPSGTSSRVTTDDINGDGVDDITDFIGSAPDMGAYALEGSSLTDDLTGDGILNILDIVMLVDIILGI